MEKITILNYWVEKMKKVEASGTREITSLGDLTLIEG
jgi:hypothetical protein